MIDYLNIAKPRLSSASTQLSLVGCIIALTGYKPILLEPPQDALELFSQILGPNEL